MSIHPWEANERKTNEVLYFWLDNVGRSHQSFSDLLGIYISALNLTSQIVQDGLDFETANDELICVYLICMYTYYQSFVF